MQSTVKRLMSLVFFCFFYTFHCGLHSAVHGEKADAFFFFFLINFLFSLLILNVFLFSYQTFMTWILSLTGYPVNLDFFFFFFISFFLLISFFMLFFLLN